MTIRDSNSVTQRLFDSLFAGIALSREEVIRAGEVIRRQFVEQMQLQDKGLMTKALWRTAVTRRNLTLRGMLRTEGDRTRFDRNVGLREPLGTRR